MKIKVFFDENYLTAFKTFLFSACVNKRPETKVEIVIGIWENNLSAHTIVGIRNFGSRLGADITFEQLGNWHLFSNENIRNPGDHIPPSSVKARMEFLVDATEDFIFMDVDMLLLPGWDDIFLPENFPQNEVIAVAPETMSSKRNNSPIAPKDNLASALNGEDFYFNAGLIMVNHRSWNEEKLTQLLEQKIADVLSGSLHVEWIDQDILNIITVNHKKALNRTFNTLIHPWQELTTNNFYSLDPSMRPKILHFIGALKPWNMENSLKGEVLRLAHEHSKAGYIDAISNWYLQYFFFENQRALWEING